MYLKKIANNMFLGKVRILIITASLLLTFFGLERLCHMATDGFALARITHPLQANGEFPPPILSSEETMTLKKILSQPFHYLSCGGQTYVFTSDDGHYVIKFLKFHHRRIPLWMQKIPLPNRLSLYLLSKMTKKEFLHFLDPVS